MRKNFVGTAVLAILAAGAASQFLYEVFVVPRLSSLAAAPLHWWLAIGTPAIIAALVCGWFTRSWREALAVAALASIGLQLGVHLAALIGRPGWHKSFAIEAPLYHYTVGIFGPLPLLLAVVGLGKVAHARLRHVAS